MNGYTFSNCTKQLKSRSSSYELTSLMWGSEGELSNDKATSRRVRGGGGGATTRRAGGGGATTHISMESSDVVSSWRKEGGAVQQQLELSTSWICEGGGGVWRRLELPTSWHEGGGAVRSREKRTSHSGLRPASSRAPNTC
jgi:hypothetical protein